MPAFPKPTATETDPVASPTAAAALALAGSRALPTKAWVTATAYLAGQMVTNGGHTYTANDAHTSGATFAGDLGSHWTLLPIAVADVTGAAPTDSPTFTGNPAGPTPTQGDNDTSLATTAFVTTAARTLPRGLTRRFIPAFPNNSGAFIAPTSGRLYLTPIWLPAGTLNLIGTHVNQLASSGGVVRLGLYSESNGKPNAVLTQSSTIATDGTTGNKGYAPAMALTYTGWYFTACVFQVAMPTNLSMNGGPVAAMPQRTYAGNVYYMNDAAAWWQDSVSSTMPGTYTEPSDPIVANAPVVAVGFS